MKDEKLEFRLDMIVTWLKVQSDLITSMNDKIDELKDMIYKLDNKGKT